MLPLSLVGLTFVYAAFAQVSPAPKAPVALEQSGEDVKRRLAQELARGDAGSVQDDSLALAVEWVHCRDSAGDRPFGGRADFFAGFLSGRCRAVPPEWWRKDIREGSASAEGAAGFACRGIARRWKGDEAKWKFSGFDDVSSSDDKLTLKLGEQQLVLAKRDFADVGRDPMTWSHDANTAIAGTVDPNICVVIFDCPTYFGSPRRLFCINSVTGRAIWKQDLHVGVLPGGALRGAVAGSFTEVRFSGDNVVVWVGHDFSMCFEMFQKSDGKRIATFATGFLDRVRIAGEAK